MTRETFADELRTLGADALAELGRLCKGEAERSKDTGNTAYWSARVADVEAEQERRARRVVTVEQPTTHRSGSRTVEVVGLPARESARDLGHTASVVSYGRGGGRVHARCSCGWTGETFDADDYGLAWKQARRHEKTERAKVEDDGPYCYCGHTEESHVGATVVEAVAGNRYERGAQCLGCIDTDDEDGTDPRHTFEAVS